MIVANCFFAESSGLRLDSVVMGSTLGIFKNMCYLKFIRETNLIIISIKTQLNLPRLWSHFRLFFFDSKEFIQPTTVRMVQIKVTN